MTDYYGMFLVCWLLFGQPALGLLLGLWLWPKVFNACQYVYGGSKC